MSTVSSMLIVICGCAVVCLLSEVGSLYLPKKGLAPYHTRERVFLEPEKRPFCNAFTGCGKKRSNLPALADNGEEMDESINSLLELSAEPAVEDLSRQIMSEAKIWEAIQEANVELNRRRQNPRLLDGEQNDAPVPAKSATASCALPPCYI
ncbi:crustacean cardioactive peptide [Leptinotarsa decemlineata]|uniref:crustacean cardioactive peptide n=1 Tax=Leptinotarsa decemlineata TaxID=7539 RepID=UPI000C252F1B|nr:cardioactive peptide [Leptinotarsa decemlineata]XP_023012720.1 cardioactive peptide [Leptinotarsa decemlineata]